MSVPPPSPLPSGHGAPATVQIENTGKVRETLPHTVTVQGKNYSVSSLHVKRPGSGVWQVIPLANLTPEQDDLLTDLVQRIQTIANGLGADFNPGNAESFSIISNRDNPGFLSQAWSWVTRKPPEENPFTFHEIIYKKPGATDFTHIKLDPIFYDDKATKQALKDTDRKAGYAMSHLLSSLPSQPNSASALTPPGPAPNATPNSSGVRNYHGLNLVPNAGEGNCQLHAIAEGLRNLPAAKKAELEGKGFRLQEPGLHLQLRAAAMRHMRDQATNISFKSVTTLQMMLDELTRAKALPKPLASVPKSDVTRRADEIITAYTDYHGKDRVSLGALSLKALAAHLNIPIAVISEKTGSNPPIHEIGTFFESSSNSRGLEDANLISLYFTPGHYEYVPSQPALISIINERKKLRLKNLSDASDQRRKESAVSILRDEFPQTFNRLCLAVDYEEPTHGDVDDFNQALTAKIRSERQAFEGWYQREIAGSPPLGALSAPPLPEEGEDP